MLTIEDCIAHARISEDELNAIVEHEHIPAILAVELADHLCRSKDGERKICQMIRDDVVAARWRGDWHRAANLERVLRKFAEAHKVDQAA